MRKGQHHSDATRAHLSAKHKGRKVSEETRAKMAAARKAYWERKRARHD